MFTPSGMGYDRAITIFSPDGRLFQVEYAFEAVKKGLTTLGIKAKDGVVLAVEKRRASPLVEGTEKIKKIDEHVGLAFAGLFGDARILIDQARYYAQVHRLLYGEKIPIELLAKRICDIKQAYTQHGGVRPFGVALLFAGIDRRGLQLIHTDPGGSYIICRAYAIGSGAQKALEMLEKRYLDDIDVKKASLLAIEVLDNIMEGKMDKDKVEMGIVTLEDKVFRILSRGEITALVESYRSSKGA